MKQFKRFTAATALAFGIAFALAGNVFAQSADKVKSDVLSALSTPLPITIVGPMLAQDVQIEEQSGNFRATLKGASLMGFFPLGEVSLTLTPEGDDTYRITDMTFPATLDFPGMATLTHTGMSLTGTWSAKTRSYSDLNWVIEGLRVAPANVPGGVIELGELSFDVIKEPDNTNTASRFAIGARNVAVRGLGSDDITLGSVSAELLANGEEPVDLYSLIREIAVRSTMRDGGTSLQTLLASLLGNTYETASLELAAEALDVTSNTPNRPSFMRAETAGISATLTNVAPRSWEEADITLTLGALDLNDPAMDGAYSVGEAQLSLRAGELPVADMFNVYTLLASAGAGRPVMADALMDGLAQFGKIEIVTNGKALNAKTLKRIYPSDTSQPSELKPNFDIAYDSWDAQLGLQDFSRDAGKIVFETALTGGTFTPQEVFDAQALPDVEAWFPKSLALKSSVGKLNEGFLKQLLTDVSINDLGEPVELVAPLLLWASSSVFEVSSGDDHYETEIFRVSQSGKYKFYPTELVNLVPYEGTAKVRFEGMGRLIGYFEKMVTRGNISADEMSIIRAGMVVMRNLGRERGDDSYEWGIAREDVRSSEIVVNGVTFRYPDISAIAPMIFGATMFR